MNIAGSTSGPLTMNYSVLKAANKQPELALELLQKSLEGSTFQSGQQAPQAVAPATSPASAGIDIRV